jgi:hypothetical protein
MEKQMSDFRFTTAEFERACSLLPDGVTWGKHLNVETVLHIADASRRMALEDAAKVCDEKQDWYEKDRCNGQAVAVSACADEIRALTNGDTN